MWDDPNFNPLKETLAFFDIDPEEFYRMARKGLRKEE